MKKCQPRKVDNNLSNKIEKFRTALALTQNQMKIYAVNLTLLINEHVRLWSSDLLK